MQKEKKPPQQITFNYPPPKVPKQSPQSYKKAIEEYQNSLNSLNPHFLTPFFPSLISLLCLSLAYLLGRFRFSITFLCVLIFGVHSIYLTRINRFKKNMEILVHRNALKTKVESFESVEWVNHIIEKFWTVLEPEVSRQVFLQVNPILEEKCPGFLSKLKIEEFTLGSHPPFVMGIRRMYFANSSSSSFDDNARGPREELEEQNKNLDIDLEYQNTEALNIIYIECEVGFVPLEISKDSYNFISQTQSFHWNSKILLTARLGKGIGIDLPFLLKNISFKGRFRIRIVLDRVLMVKNVEFFFMDVPEIDFTLKPLKSVDLMDLPGLSNALHAIINTALKTCINPNSIKIDLQPKKEEKNILGVMLLNLRGIKNKEDEENTLIVEIDGRKHFKTARKGGKSNFYNEYFYLIVENLDERIGIRGENGFGWVFLRKVVEIGNFFEEIKMYKKGHLRSTVNASFHFFPKLAINLSSKEKETGKKDEKEKDQINKMADKSQISSRRSAICRVKIISFENLAHKRLVSPFFTAIISPKVELKPENLAKNRNFFSFVTGPVNATALLVGGAISSAGNVLNVTKKEEEILPSSNETFYMHESKRINECNSPFFNEKFEFFSRDLKNEFLYLCVNSENEVLGRFEVCMWDIKNDTYRLKNSQNGKVKIEIEKFYVDLLHEEKIINYTRIFKIDVRDILNARNGSYYALIKTHQRTFYIDPFFIGDLPCLREAFFWVVDEKEVEVMVFKEGRDNDEFIGHTTIELDVNMDDILKNKSDAKQTKNVDTESLIEEENKLTNELLNQRGLHEQKDLIKKTDDKKVRGNLKIDPHMEEAKGLDRVLDPNKDKTNNIELKSPEGKVKSYKLMKREDENGILKIEISGSKLLPYKGIPTDNLKVVQVKFGDFSGIKEEFLVEFKIGDEIVQRSPVSVGKKINEVFCFYAGREEICAIFKSGEQSVNKILGECLIPKRKMHERVILDGEFCADVHIDVHSCSFIQNEFMKHGDLEVFLREGKNLKDVDKSGFSDPYAKVFYNSERIFKTNVHKKTLNPVFNEKIAIRDINIKNDFLRVEIWDWNAFETQTLIGAREIPLYFLREGLNDINLDIYDSEKKSGEISIGFNFFR